MTPRLQLLLAHSLLGQATGTHMVTKEDPDTATANEVAAVSVLVMTVLLAAAEAEIMIVPPAETKAEVEIAAHTPSTAKAVCANIVYQMHTVVSLLHHRNKNHSSSTSTTAQTTTIA